MRMRRGEGARPLKHFLVPAAAARPKRGGRLAGRGEREEGGGGGGWCLGVCVFERGERKSVSGLVYKGQGGDLGRSLLVLAVNAVAQSTTAAEHWHEHSSSGLSIL